MRITSFVNKSIEETGLIIESLLIPIRNINDRLSTNWPVEMLDIIRSNSLTTITNWYDRNKETLIKDCKDVAIPLSDINYAPLYRNPNKIWGIGLNYKDHAKDLSESAPEKIPASFMKPTTTIIGYGNTINLPLLSERTTGEAELGIIIGKKTINIDRDNWLDAVAGFTNIIDMTAEDILRKNPRYLTVCKSFDTFLALALN